MDEEYKYIFDDLNTIIYSDFDNKFKSLIFETYIKGFQIGLSSIMNVDFKDLLKFLKLNV